VAEGVQQDDTHAGYYRAAMVLMQGKRGNPPCPAVFASGILRFPMKIIVLGSGTSTGVPMVGCDCPVCRSADPRDQRTRASLLIQYGGRNILVDTCPDLRQQMLREQVSQVDAVLFTHAHADHVNGIDDLRGFHFRHRSVVPSYACPAVLERLLGGFRYIFERGAQDTHPALLRPISIDGPFELFGLTVVPVELVHGPGTSCGYRIGSFAYLTDCSGISDSSMALLQGVTTVVIDGLRWSSHPFHFNIQGAIAAAQALRADRIILTHLTHEVAHAESARLPAGVEFAYDGMTLQLGEE
jgi:phosphoribosyl 1,2-cyclic phosphate phosphodiesterase